MKLSQRQRRAVPVAAVLALGAATAVVAPATAAPSATLQVGSSGARVDTLKHYLEVLGHFTRVTTNQNFGPSTAAAVENFQRAAGLPVTGKVTRDGWDALAAAYALKLVAPSTPALSLRWQDCTITLDGVEVSLGKTQRTRTIVDGQGGTTAAISFYARTDSACGVERVFTTLGRVGYGGITDGAIRRQGTGTTPTGTYTMTEAFGLDPAPLTAMPFRAVRSNDWWVQDNNSTYYNTYRSGDLGGFVRSTSSSERLTDYKGQYDYAIVINFNRAPDFQRKGRGSGIFWHVNGKGATAGCLSVAEQAMVTVLSYLKPGDKITIRK